MLSVSVVPSVSVDSVIESVMFCFLFEQTGFLIKRVPHFIRQLKGKMKSGCPERREKRGSKFQGPRASRPPCVCKLVFGVDILDLNLGIQINPVKQPVKSNSVGSGHMSHCWTSDFDDPD